MRSERGVVWPYLVLSVALIGALTFGWYQTREKNQLALDAENKYMSAFHGLKWTSENIEESTAKLMATNDPTTQQSLLADLRVYSTQAVDKMSVLPFTTLNTPRIQQFLNTMRQRTDEYYHKINEGQSLSDQEWAQIRDLRRQSVAFESELSHFLGLVGTNSIRWRDTVRVTGATQSGSATTPITRSAMSLDRSLSGPAEQGAALSFNNSTVLAPPKMDLGPRVDERTAVAAIKDFVGGPLKAEPVLTGQSDPSGQLKQMSLYFFDAQKADGTPLHFGVSTKGGHIVYMLDGRPVTHKNFTKEQLMSKAQQMLDRWKYTGAGFVSAVETDGTMVLDFAPRQGGVAIQTDMIRVSLAMDDAELVGFDARSYWTNHHQRTLPAPRLSAAQAARAVSSRLVVEGSPVLEVVADRRNQERLVWQVYGTLDDQKYHVYVDAMTGEEVEVQRISGDPAPALKG